MFIEMNIYKGFLMNKLGFIIGKFYPMHIGHVSLIEFGRQQIINGTIDNLIILVDNHISYNISLIDRVNCIKDEFPDVEVRGIEESTFQEPSEVDCFWDYWNNIINKYIPEQKDLIIGSEEYIKTLSKNLNIDYLLMDLRREGVDFSARNFRKNIKDNWIYLSRSSKKMLTKNIAIVGAESSGKSTLVKFLSKKYNTVYTPEYARTLIENKGRELEKNDFLTIQKNHYSHHNSLLKESNYINFLDTEAISTKIWFNTFFKNEEDIFLNNYINKQKIDLFLLLKPQKEWVEDTVRYQSEYLDRYAFFKDLKKYLEENKLNFKIIESTCFDNIEDEACKIIDKEGFYNEPME
jgi:HTH-type transcriptional repressor of NAD biosynthesis genes